jgi:predicted transcriptional regulator
MMKYRSRTDIVSQILESASSGATKTRIMYRAYLSYAQLKEYIAVLVENGLLEFEKGGQTYKTTAKGHMFLKTYSQIGGLMVPDTE